MQELNNTFVLYANYYEILKDLNDEDLGIIFRTILEYKATGNYKDLPSHLMIAFKFIKNQLDIDSAKYAEISAKRKEAGVKGGKQKVANLANAKFAKQKVANLANAKFAKHNDNDNDNDNDNANENENENENGKFFHPRTHEEILPYGDYFNVGLTDMQRNKVDTMTLNKEVAIELIDELSRNIASGKEPDFDIKKPDAHIAILEKYWNFRRKNPQSFKPPNSEKSNADLIEEVLSEEF